MDDNNFVEVPSFSVDESMELLRALMSQEQRCLSEAQQQVVQEAFAGCSSPLYVRLITADARSWTSMNNVEASSLPSGVKECINSFLDQLEKTHGRTLVSHSLAYLTASITGLSDNEMEDVLSLDDAVLSEVYANRPMIISRLPPVSWQKIKYDMRDFLVTRECEGLTTFYWNHRIFIETAKTRYLNDETRRKLIHAGLADYMLGTW
ncbi:hypothetical protein CAPTEDRAFT_145944, partial [Capitella teleta]|uniref:NWD1/2-like winged helix-turn-helix domain-containing protein n=1 Tax=Capitella teleta TaxID=283909 RepID=X1Z4E8_CAPTE